MEEIEYKLHSQNPILISHAISKIFESIAKTENNSSANSHQDLLKNTKVRLILSKCQSEETLVSTTCLLGLVTLAETGILSVSSVLSSLISSIGFTKNHTALIVAINSLLILDLKIKVIEGSYVCPFELNSPQHPFVSLLNQEKEVWRGLLSQIRFDINHHQPMVSSNSAKLLRPVFLHILLNPKSNLPEICRQQTWNLLIKSNMIDLKIEILQWLSIRDISSLIDTNHRLLELAEVTILMNEEHFLSALMPLIAYCGMQILKQGHDPRPNLDILIEIVKKNLSGGFCLTIAILSCSIAECPVVYLASLIQTCEFLLKKGSCSALVANGLLSSLLQWQAYPSILTSDSQNIAKALIDEIQSQRATWNCDTKILLQNKIFQILIDSFPDLQFHTQLCNLNFQFQKEILSWLENLLQAPKNLKQSLKHLLYGLLLQTQDSPKITTSLCDVLAQISDSNLVASQMLTLILYKLTNSRSVKESYNLLLTVPKLATVKENLPIIVHTFETFLNSGEPALKYLAVELYYRAWKKEARLHSCLVKVLIDVGNENNFNSEIVCAKVMKEMCEVRPESAVELLPLLSEILNRKKDKDGVPSALALQGISALCKSGIIDVSSAWKVLAPKFENEKRSVVLKSLCEFISEIPSFFQEESVVNLLSSLLSKLWNLVLYSNDKQVSKLAFKALKSFKFQLLTQQLLPTNFLYQQDLETNNCGETNLDSIEIPGTYWIHMLESINSDLISSAGDLLIAYIEDETKFLPRFRAGGATSYKSLSNKSIIKVIGETLMAFEPASCNNHQRMIVTELLRIFANKYSNPLPSVDYGFLRKCKFSQHSTELCFRIVSNQAEVSASARKILEQHLTTIPTNQEMDPKEFSNFYSNLESICKGASPHILHNFLQVSLNLMVQKSLLGDKNYLKEFKKAMGSFERTLTDETQPENVREILVSVLENFFERVIDEDSIFESYLSAILKIPRVDLIRITSGDWKQVNVSRLYKAMLIRTEWALKQNKDEECWSVVEEIFQDCIFRSETLGCVLRTIRRIQIQKRLLSIGS